MILLKGGLVVDPESETTRIADVLIEDGVITNIGNIDIEAIDNANIDIYTNIDNRMCKSGANLMNMGS